MNTMFGGMPHYNPHTLGAPYDPQDFIGKTAWFVLANHTYYLTVDNLPKEGDDTGNIPVQSIALHLSTGPTFPQPQLTRHWQIYLDIHPSSTVQVDSGERLVTVELDPLHRRPNAHSVPHSRGIPWRPTMGTGYVWGGTTVVGMSNAHTTHPTYKGHATIHVCPGLTVRSILHGLINGQDMDHPPGLQICPVNYGVPERETSLEWCMRLLRYFENSGWIARGWEQQVMNVFMTYDLGLSFHDGLWRVAELDPTTANV